MNRPPVDASERAQVRTELATNFLVEAGAGSGKTTLLVDRMSALVESGTADVARIAAVTFTRKAAAELRERFQMMLEKRFREEREARPEGEKAKRLQRGIERIDRAFLGTIHAFCARLLRERPIEAGLDPDFAEAPEAEAQLLQDRFWTGFLERIVADSDPLLEQLAAAGLRLHELRRAFDQMVEHLDISYPAPPVDPPGAGEMKEVRDRLEGLLDRALHMMPEEEPEKGWDYAQKVVRELRFARRFQNWNNPAHLFDAAEAMCSVKKKLYLNRWPHPRWEVVGLRDDFEALSREDGMVRGHLDRWLAHRYHLAISLVRRAAREFAEERRRIGMLNFHDLLVLTAKLLREYPRVRKYLGERYRYILVDEFQDTDPVQAELLFLLASEPDDEPKPDWLAVVPRPGALFVVGDPKQSIYRFRRADIVVYNQVRTRFRTFGAVLLLTTNFRSRATLAGMVNTVFDDPVRFPKEETDRQARFAPMAPYPRTSDGPEGVYHYFVPNGRAFPGKKAIDAEADMLANWIRRRIESGERRARDFLVLTRKKAGLDLYARALEEHNLTIEVSGAQTGPEEELRELALLLRTLIDPGDPVNVVAVLTGLFFGLDHEQLAEHALAGGRFDFTFLPEQWRSDRDRAGRSDGRKGEDPLPNTAPQSPPASEDGKDEAGRVGSGGPVAEALATLHDWWRESRRDPADILVGRLVDRLGLMPYAAAGDLGTLKAGILGYALDAVRAEVVRGDASLAGALEALEAALIWEDAEAPFDTGPTDAVRVMNLHKAKGLEATVVVLAAPGQTRSRKPTSHTRRRKDGKAERFTVISTKTGRYVSRTLARPLDWPALKQEEERYLAAEETRILYVSCTRAREELLVARRPKPGLTSRWGIFEKWLNGNGMHLNLGRGDPPPRELLTEGAPELLAETEAAEAGLAAAAKPTHEFVSVRRLAKEEPTNPGSVSNEGQGPVDIRGSGVKSAPPRPGDDEVSGDEVRGRERRTLTSSAGKSKQMDRTSTLRASGRGRDWGMVVHSALEAAAWGAKGKTLEHTARALLAEFERPLEEDGTPRELGELMALLERVRSSEIWQRAHRAPVRHVEVPFAVEHPRSAGGDIPRLVEGVIDLAFREPGGWVIVDYKTDLGDDPDFSSRHKAYRRQLELYAQCWEAITGERVRERVILFTALEKEERW